MDEPLSSLGAASTDADSFPRHTLIYALGALGRSILRRGMDDAAVASRHRAWLEGCDGDALELLVTTGLDGGTVSLLARSQPGEFCLNCEHEDFRALVALGFDVATGELNGVLLASFEGDPVAANAFAMQLTRKMGERPAPRQTRFQPQTKTKTKAGLS